MPTNLSPIARHLILIFGSCSHCLSVMQIREQFPDADEPRVYHELLALHRAGIVHRGLAAGTRQVVYWFASAVTPTGVRPWGAGKDGRPLESDAPTTLIRYA